MAQKHLLRGTLILFLCMAVATPARADKLSDDVAGIIAGIVVVTIGVTLGVAFVVVHYSKKRTVTGCVVSAPGGCPSPMKVTSESTLYLATPPRSGRAIE